MYSYSAIKDYKQCPNLYYEKRVLKSVKFLPTPATEYGVRLHKAFEDYVRDGTEIPDEFAKFEPTIAAIKEMDGDKLCEVPMAVDGMMNAVPYFDPSVPEPKLWNSNPAGFIGGFADLIIVGDGDTAIYIDYKSGGDKYPDMEQCELMSLLMFAQMPWVNTIDAGLLFVKHNRLVSQKYHRADMDATWNKWVAAIARIEQSRVTDVWQKKPSNLCPWCQVKHCPEWTER